MDPNREEMFFNGATLPDGEAVLRQRCKISPHFRERVVDVEHYLVEVG